MYPKANEELLKVQKPIFKELSKLVDEMPYAIKPDLRTFKDFSFQIGRKRICP